jgi:hypothetical protein
MIKNWEERMPQGTDYRFEDQDADTSWDRIVAMQAEIDELRAAQPDLLTALNRASYALFQMRRMVPEAIKDFADAECKASCAVLDRYPSAEPPAHQSPDGHGAV